jgi:hypothetical protein
MIKLYFPFFLCLGCVFIFTGCDEFPDTTEKDAPVVVSEAEIHAYFTDVEDMAEAVLSESRVLNTTETRMDLFVADPRLECATIYLDGTQRDEPAIIWIDFGEGCEDAQGNVRRGRVRMEISTLRRNSDNVMVTTLHDYRFNEAAIEGKITSDNVLDLQEEMLTATVWVEDGRVTWGDGRSATRASEMEKRLSLNIDQPATWTLTGKAFGVYTTGKEYYMEIIEQLTYSRDCIRQGVYIPSAGFSMFQYDYFTAFTAYGEGNCDRDVIINLHDRDNPETLTFSNIYQ